MDNNSNEYYTPGELAQKAGCRPQMIYNYMRSGKLPYGTTEINTESNLGATLNNGVVERYVIPKEAAERWLAEYLKRKALKAYKQT